MGYAFITDSTEATDVQSHSANSIYSVLNTLDAKKIKPNSPLTGPRQAQVIINQTKSQPADPETAYDRLLAFAAAGAMATKDWRAIQYEAAAGAERILHEIFHTDETLVDKDACDQIQRIERTGFFTNHNDIAKPEQQIPQALAVVLDQGFQHTLMHDVLALYQKNDKTNAEKHQTAQSLIQIYAKEYCLV